MKKSKKVRVDKISIGGMPFKVKYFKEFPKALIAELGEGLAGYCDWPNQEIGVLLHGKNATLDKLTLFHEIGHAVADSIKVNNGLANETFAKPFFQFFFGALIDAGLIRL